MRALALLLLLALAGAASAAPRHGLVWNRTGLPAVFPLQIRSLPGRDLFVILRDADSGEDALAAYAEGGRFFRVLVPPGTFKMHVAMGTEWRDERALFGPDTDFYTHPEALDFGVTGLDRKSGHLLDLRRMGPEVEARAIGLCQFVTRDADDVRAWRDFLLDPEAEYEDIPRIDGPDVRERICD